MIRLLNTSTYELREFTENDRPSYAILSHRWLDGEITFDNRASVDLKDEDALNPSLEKIRGTCAMARKEDLEWAWIDSYCIDRASSEEMDASLNSMYEWYKTAAICLVHLSDVEKSTSQNQGTFTQIAAADQTSEWFKRGFTLQESLAPQKLDFFDHNWTYLGSKSELASEIEELTGIPSRFIDGTEPLSNASVAQKLSWQSHRRTSKEEDLVYSLLGILGVTLTPAYGEGRKAFARLQEKLVGKTMDESLFAWRTPSDDASTSAQEITAQGDCWGLLAPWVDCFERSGDITVRANTTPRPEQGAFKDAKGVGIWMPIGDLYNGCESRPRDNENLQMVVDVLCYIVFGLFYCCFVAAVNAARKGSMTEQDYTHLRTTNFPLTLSCYQNGIPLRIILRRVQKDDLVWKRHLCASLAPRGGRQVDTIAELGIWEAYKTDIMASQMPLNWMHITVIQPS